MSPTSPSLPHGRDRRRTGSAGVGSSSSSARLLQRRNSHLLAKKRIVFQLQQSNAAQGNTTAYASSKQDEKDDTVEKIKLNLSRAMQEPDMLPLNKPRESIGVTLAPGFQHGTSSLGKEGVGSPWSRSA